MGATTDRAQTSVVLAMLFNVLAYFALAQAPVGPISQTTPAQTTAPQTPVVPVAQPLVTPDFTVAPVVPDPTRIEMSPRLDGKIDEEEWDPFSTSGPNKTYFQWEPGILYAAATGPVGQDMLLSADLDADGWLHGEENLEARLSMKDGKPVLTVRELDATNKAGPAWRDMPGFDMASEVNAVSDGANVTYELKLRDPGFDMLPTKPGKCDLRIDMVPSSDPPRDPYLPRAMAEVNLATSRAAALPPDLNWGVQRNNRNFIPGDSAWIRMTFNAKKPVPIKNVELRSEWVAKDATNQETIPFPAFDSKGRAFIDYSTKLPAGMDTGYRVLRTTVNTADGTPGIIEASYRVAPILDFSIVQPNLKVASNDRSIKVAFYLTSNIDRVVEGDVQIAPAPGFRLLNAGDLVKYKVTEPRGSVRISVDLLVPANYTGSAPLVFKVTANGKTDTYTRYVNVG